MFFGVVDEGPVVADRADGLGGPAGEGPGELADVPLGVALALAHGEQLHHLAGEVLVGAALDVEAVVQPDQHRGVLRHGDQQPAEVARGVLSEGLVLPEQQFVVEYLFLAGREVVVPEERHLLFERAGRTDHPVGPPMPDPHHLDVFAHQQRIKLIDGGLILQRRLLLRLDAERLAGDERGEDDVFEPGELIAVGVDARRLELGELSVADPLVVHEVIDRRLGVIAASSATSSGVPPKPARSRRWAACRGVHSSAVIGSSRSASAAAANTAMNTIKPESFQINMSSPCLAAKRSGAFGGLTHAAMKKRSAALRG